MAEIAIVEQVDSSRGTVNLRVAGSGKKDEFLLKKVSIASSSPSLRTLPQIGDMCVIVKVGHEYVCVGFLDRTNADAIAKNEERDLYPGDLQIGDSENGRIARFEGGGIVMDSNNAGVSVFGNKRLVSVMGKDINFDTANVHKKWDTDLLGEVQIRESTYGTKGKVTSTKIDSGSAENFYGGEVHHDISRVKNIKLTINDGLAPTLVTALGKGLESVKFEVLTEVGNLTIKWDNITKEFVLNVPGALKINALTTLNLEAPSINLNCEGINPLEGVINGTYQCQFTGAPLGTTLQQSMTVKSG